MIELIEPLGQNRRRVHRRDSVSLSLLGCRSDDGLPACGAIAAVAFRTAMHGSPGDYRMKCSCSNLGSMSKHLIESIASRYRLSNRDVPLRRWRGWKDFENLKSEIRPTHCAHHSQIGTTVTTPQHKPIAGAGPVNVRKTVVDLPVDRDAAGLGKRAVQP